MPDLMRAAYNVLDTNLRLQAADRFVAVVDPGKEQLVEALAAACSQRGIDFTVFRLDHEPEYELPASIRAALLGCTAALISTSRSYTHTDGVRAAAKAGARLATNSRLSERQLAAGLLVDYSRVAEDARRYGALLERAAHVLIRSAGGAELSFRIAGQRGLGETGLYDQPGMVGNLPAGEAACGIDDGTGDGVLVVNGSWPALGMLGSPLELTFEGGRLLRVAGDRAAELETALDAHGPNARCLAELGLGMNPAFQVQGNTLLDEKVAGTIHVAVGNDVSFGGSNNVGYHADGVVLGAQLFLDGSKVELPGSRSALAEEAT